jgi:hypothetical protein
MAALPFRHLGVFAAVLALVGCSGRLTVESLQKSRQDVLQKAFTAHVFDPNRAITHASHVCSLRLAGQWYPVLDVQEIVKGAVVPRGANSIVVLDPSLAVAMRMPYATERPLFCDENRLYVWGDLQVEAASAEGNELTFTDRASHVLARHVEANDVPAPSGKSSPGQ